MLSDSFQNKVSVIAGGASGMGHAVVEYLARHGSSIFVLDNNFPQNQLPIQGDVTRLKGDLTNYRFVTESIEHIKNLHGRLDFLVNTVGVLWFDRDRSFADIDLQDWDKIIAINLKSMVHTSRACVPLMQAAGSGAMVHFSSIQCLKGDNQPQDAYQASKAAIIALSKSIAIQYAGQNIRSNVILPGPCHTPMQKRWDENPLSLEAISKQIPLGRAGEAEDMANACCFLLSDQASFITGTELIVDGGLMAKP